MNDEMINVFGIIGDLNFLKERLFVIKYNYIDE